MRLGLLHRQDPIHIVLDRQQLPHGGAGLPVLSVSLFLIRQQLGILGLKLLDATEVVKGANFIILSARPYNCLLYTST